MINPSFARNLTSVAARSANGGLNAGRQQVTRSLVGRSLLQTSSRRMASTQSAQKQVKSDAPWAITSLVVFGGMFVYLTSPSSGAKHGDAHHGGHGTAEEKSDEEEESSSDDDASYDSYVDVKKIEDKPGDDAPSGSKALAAKSLTADEGAHLQKPTKTGKDIQKADDITFKHGVAAAKEGHSDPEKRISDPKKVVASAHTEREGKKEEKESKENDDKDDEE